MVARILIGQFPDGDTGIRVSQAGYDAASNPVNNEYMIFNSSWPGMLNIYARGTFNVSRNGGSVTASYSDLGYVPIAYIAVRPFGGRNNWGYYDTFHYTPVTDANFKTFNVITDYDGYFRIQIFSNQIVATYTGWTTGNTGQDQPPSFQVIYAVTSKRVF